LTADCGARARAPAEERRAAACCRDYRTALRGIEKQLNGLAPASGPLTAIAKILGIGGASSGAAAGGGAAFLGGGAGAGAAVGGTTAATIGTGAVAATAGKVAAVVAAAAVVGGGAATVERKVDHHRAPAARVSHVAAGLAATPIATQHRVDPGRHISLSAARVKTSHGAAVAPHDAHVRQAGDEPVSSAGIGVPKLESNSGGLQAPDADATTTTAGDGTAGTTTGAGEATSPGTATTGTTTTSAGTTTAAGAETNATATGTAGATTTTPGTGATSATGSGGTSAPASPPATPSSPIAQGATAPPAG
jgi:hypothetical protein